MSTPDSPPEKAIAKEETAPAKAAATFQAPGVYVEEIAHTGKSIEGVTTGTTAFVGIAARGPEAGTAPEMLTSFTDFQMIYGKLPEPVRGGITFPAPSLSAGYLEVAVKAFFENGGRRLYIGRVTVTDGASPTIEDYRAALVTLEDLVDVSIVAAPGAAVAGAIPIEQVAPIHAELIAHASRQGAYRIAVLDPPPGCSISEIRTLRAQVDSSYAALYYPWVTIIDPTSTPTTAGRINVPPSGAICGIFCRVDTTRGVYKAPANEVITGSIAFERALTADENEVLNPLGINCLRNFVGRGNRVWGARTVSSDPEWKYVNIRRYFLYMERSIDEGTKWVVFEPNNERTWATVQRAIADFLTNEWNSGALLGDKPEKAFFVKCDRTTMTQTDIDNGRLICEVGVAPLKPAEFVIFRIGQWTADGKIPPP
jgi:phage tail sheath protein FI